jgi:hypothetical protein
MRKILVLIPLAAGVACASAPTAPAGEFAPTPGDVELAGRCFDLHINGVVATDVRLPGLIELSRQPAPYFVEPGRLAVREAAATEPRAPISWWRPTGESSLELVLGGGFTGYHFSMTHSGSAWVGQGTYFADFGVEPPPDLLLLRLTQQSCP